MTMNGAANRTLNEIRSALQITGASDQEINQGYQSLIAQFPHDNCNAISR